MITVNLHFNNIFIGSFQICCGDVHKQNYTNCVLDQILMQQTVYVVSSILGYILQHIKFVSIMTFN